jgi:hypothetical protein
MCSGCNNRKKNNNLIGYCHLHNTSKHSFLQQYTCSDLSDDSAISDDVRASLLKWNSFKRPISSTDNNNNSVAFSFMYEGEEFVRVRDISSIMGCNEISFYKSGGGGWQHNRIRFKHKTNARAITFHGNFITKNTQSSNGVQCVLRRVAEEYVRRRKGNGCYFQLKHLPLFEGNETKF